MTCRRLMLGLVFWGGAVVAQAADAPYPNCALLFAEQLRNSELCLFCNRYDPGIHVSPGFSGERRSIGDEHQVFRAGHAPVVSRYRGYEGEPTPSDLFFGPDPMNDLTTRVHLKAKAGLLRNYADRDALSEFDRQLLWGSGVQSGLGRQGFATVWSEANPESALGLLRVYHGRKAASASDPVLGTEGWFRARDPSFPYDGSSLPMDFDLWSRLGKVPETVQAARREGKEVFELGNTFVDPSLPPAQRAEAHAALMTWLLDAYLDKNPDALFALSTFSDSRAELFEKSYGFKHRELVGRNAEGGPEYVLSATGRELAEALRANLRHLSAEHWPTEATLPSPRARPVPPTSSP